MTDDKSPRSLREIPRDQPHLLDYVRVLLRRKYLVMFVFLMVMLGAAAYLYTTIPVYEARSRLLIEAGPSPAAGEAAEQSEAQQGYYQTHYQLLQSRNLARKTIASLGLWNRPELNASLNRNQYSPRNIAKSAWALAQPYLEKTPLAAKPVKPVPVTLEEKEARAQDRVVSEFIQHLSVNPVQNSRLVDVIFRSSNPELAVTVVNGLSTTYISESLDSRVTASRETSDWLTEQIEKQRAQVAASEGALQRYREQHDALSVEAGQNIVVQKLADLNAAVTKANTERVQREAIYRQVASVSDQPTNLYSIPAILGNTFVQQQRAELATLEREQVEMADRLGERHPDMIKVRVAIQNVQTRLRAAVENVVQSLRRDYESAVAQEESLTRALNQQKAEAQGMNRKAIEYAVLQREVESNKESYDTLLQRARQTAVSSELRTSNVRIVDLAAEPDAPISPKRTQILLIALLVGTFLAISAAFFVEYLDHRVKTPEEIETHLRLSSLGMIPLLSRKSRKAFAANKLINNGVPSNFAEAFRGLRTNVLFSSPDGGRCSIVVTSASPREGKTIVASNLAVGLAQAGHRVILLDADLRRPRVHDLFGLSLEPGLSNLLVGENDEADVVKATNIPNLSAVTAGAHPPNPAELVGSTRFGELLEYLEQRCDIVVIDTPPVMAVADAAILAHRTSGVLFVVAADTTSRHAAQTALDQLDRARGRFLGAVLNRVDFDRDNYHYVRDSRAEYTTARPSTSLH